MKSQLIDRIDSLRDKLAEKAGAQEERQLSPRKGEDFEETQGKRARELIHRGLVEVVVVSMGSAGSLLVTSDGVEKVATPTVPIRSRVGAGDCMVAGMVLGLARRFDLRRATELGVAAGAAAVMTPGSELCRRKDVESLFERISGASL